MTVTVAALTPTQIDRSGSILLPTPTVPAGPTATVAVSAPQAPGMFFLVKWTVADSITVVIPGGGPDGTTATKTIPLGGGAGSGTAMVGPFPQAVYGSTVQASAALATTLVAAAQLTPAYN